MLDPRYFPSMFRRGYVECPMTVSSWICFAVLRKTALGHGYDKVWFQSWLNPMNDIYITIGGSVNRLTIQRSQTSSTPITQVLQNNLLITMALPISPFMVHFPNNYNYQVPFLGRESDFPVNLFRADQASILTMEQNGEVTVAIPAHWEDFTIDVILSLAPDLAPYREVIPKFFVPTRNQATVLIRNGPMRGQTLKFKNKTQTTINGIVAKADAKYFVRIIPTPRWMLGFTPIIGLGVPP